MKPDTIKDLLSDDVHDSTKWIVTNYSQQNAWDDYWEDYKEDELEEIEDKDLGLVRKINLN